MRFWAIVISFSMISCGLQPLLKETAMAMSPSNASCCSKMEKEHCAKESSNQQQSNKEDCCARLSCCACCCLYTPQESAIQFVNLLTAENQKVLRNEDALASFSADCWHPPRH